MKHKFNNVKTAKKVVRNNRVNFSGNVLGKTVSLSGNDSQNINKITNLMVDIIRRQRRLWRKEITDWQAGRYAFYQSEIPKNYQMQEVYDDVLLDGHLTCVTEQRTLRTTNKKYIFTVNGIKDDKLSELIEDKEWFETIIDEAHKSIYRGETFIFIKDFEKGNIKEVELIDRGLHIPGQKILLSDINGNSGIDVSEVNDVLLYAKFYNNIGILEKAAPYAILKRHSWGSWDEFEEMFGVPIRIAKVASQSDAVKNEVASWLEEMGSAAYGVFPIGTEIEIKENSKTDAFNVFYMKIQALDKELSKLILHQTMTTENGSSRSQGEVHENTLEEVTKSDKKKMLSFLNKRLVTAMRLIGYKIPENAKIGIEQTVDPKEQIKIDTELMGNGYVLKKQYIEKTYGVEIERMPSEDRPLKEKNTTGKA